MMTFPLDASDVAFVPVRPTAADVWTMTLMDGHIAEAMSGNPGLAAFALFNLASTNPTQPAAEETRRVLKQGCTAMEVAGPTLCDRVACQRAFAVGWTVEEYGTRAENAARRARRAARGRVRRSTHKRGFREGGLSDPNYEKTGETDMAIQMAPPESSGSGKDSGQRMRGTAKEPRMYIAFRPTEGVARKIHLVATGRGMTPTDYILECM